MNWLWTKPAETTATSNTEQPTVVAENSASVGTTSLTPVRTPTNTSSHQVESELDDIYQSIEDMGSDMGFLKEKSDELQKLVQETQQKFDEYQEETKKKLDDFDMKFLIIERSNVEAALEAIPVTTTGNEDNEEKIKYHLEITKTMIENKFDQLKRTIANTEKQTEQLRGSIAELKNKQEQAIHQSKQIIMAEVREMVELEKKAWKESILTEVTSMMEQLHKKINEEQEQQNQTIASSITSLKEQQIVIPVVQTVAVVERERRNSNVSYSPINNNDEAPMATGSDPNVITVELDIGFSKTYPLPNNYQELEKKVLESLANLEKYRSRFENNKNQGLPNFITKTTNQVVTEEMFNENPAQFLRLKLKK